MNSPFKSRAYVYIERGYCVIPIAPGTKRPGAYSTVEGWRGMSDWERYFQRMPTELELEEWDKWPDAGIGLLCGKQSGIVALDRDYNTDGTDALELIIPWTPVKKRGAKGYTAFFRYNGEPSCSFNIGGARVLDVLSDGRQTLMPGTRHPEGHTYVYLTEDMLEEYQVEDLPLLPEGFLQRVQATIAPYQTEADTKYQSRKVTKPKDSTDRINTNQSAAAEFYSRLNQQALANLDLWVPRLIPTSRHHGDGYRCIATWRKAENPNVGVNPNGIFDFGGNYGMTAIDLVMNTHQVPFVRAVDALAELVPVDGLPDFVVPDGFGATGGVAPAPAGDSRQEPPPQAVAAPDIPPAPDISSSPPVAADRILLPPTTSEEAAPALPPFVINPPGMLGEIARWIAATAPKEQPELAVAAAIALGSVVMARTYVSQFNNFTSLYFIMVAKSTEGKEHPQSAVQQILTEAGLPELIGGSGYTSAGAVFSQLLQAPAHLACIDEIGKMLKLSRAKGNSNGEAAIDKLVEAYGRVNGVMRPPTYSQMTLRQDQQVQARVVYNPGITLLGATTGNTFYSNLTDDLIKDGFLGRCIVVESTRPRQLINLNSRAADVPFHITEWCKLVHITGQAFGDLAGVCGPDVKPNTIPLVFDDACLPLIQAFERKLNGWKDKFEHEGVDVLLGRTLEKSLRLAMIACKAERAQNTVITPQHLKWAIEYVQYYDSRLLDAVTRSRTVSQFDEQLQRMLGYIQKVRKLTSAADGQSALMAQGFMPRSKLLKLMKCKAKELDELVDTAVQAKLISKTIENSLVECYVAT
jgi:Bifunctional DNA primase/polymerase, N-terminal